MEVIMRRASLLILLLLFALFVVASVSIPGNNRVQSQSKPAYTSVLTSRQSTASSARVYLYFVLKEPAGFLLARASEGDAHQPLSAPRPITLIGSGFGQSEADAVLSLQLSPDGRYLAIDGTRPDAEQVWIYDTQRMRVNLLPADAQGNFLRWLPNGNRHTFLYRPMFPVGAVSRAEMQAWSATMWQVDAATGAHKSINLGVPAANLIDAAPSPDGRHIIYSTTTGLSQGSDTWLMNSNGATRKHLFKNTGTEAINALFSWSPNGKHIIYERLVDSATPFLNAGLWLMNAQGGQLQRLAATDGGHGYTPSWSSDSRKVAFIVRTNLYDVQANIRAQSLQSAIDVVDIVSKKISQVASPHETGMQLNINPTWTDNNTRITFTALNAPNLLLGGTLRYWSVPVSSSGIHQAATTVTSAMTHIVAVS
jgi:dipeptidyl aminopeptidase/acylaminoacyl peptidase